jgi:RHS repeat-associated protein
LLQTYVHGPEIDEILWKQNTTGEVYFHHDSLGSTIALTDETGAVVESYQYDAFGSFSIYGASNSALSASPRENRFLFTGREWIGEIGIYDYRNRIYSPELGRFLQTDPIRFGAGDVNLYRYVGNSPIDWVDEQGLQGGRPGQRSPRRNKSPGITGGSLVHAGILWYYVKKGFIGDDLGHCQAHCEMSKKSAKGHPSGWEILRRFGIIGLEQVETITVKTRLRMRKEGNARTIREDACVVALINNQHEAIKDLVVFPRHQFCLHLPPCPRPSTLIEPSQTI